MKLPTQLPVPAPLNGTPTTIRAGKARPKVADSPPLGPRENDTKIDDAVDAALRAQRALTEVDQALAKDVLASPSADALTRGAVALSDLSRCLRAAVNQGEDAREQAYQTGRGAMLQFHAILSRLEFREASKPPLDAQTRGAAEDLRIAGLTAARDLGQLAQTGAGRETKATSELDLVAKLGLLQDRIALGDEGSVPRLRAFEDVRDLLRDSMDIIVAAAAKRGATPAKIEKLKAALAEKVEPDQLDHQLFQWKFGAIDCLYSTHLYNAAYGAISALSDDSCVDALGLRPPAAGTSAFDQLSPQGRKALLNALELGEHDGPEAATKYRAFVTQLIEGTTAALELKDFQAVHAMQRKLAGGIAAVIEADRDVVGAKALVGELRGVHQGRARLYRNALLGAVSSGFGDHRLRGAVDLTEMYHRDRGLEDSISSPIGDLYRATRQSLEDLDHLKRSLPQAEEQRLIDRIVEHGYAAVVYEPLPAPSPPDLGALSGLTFLDAKASARLKAAVTEVAHRRDQSQAVGTMAKKVAFVSQHKFSDLAAVGFDGSKPITEVVNALRARLTREGVSETSVEQLLRDLQKSVEALASTGAWKGATWGTQQISDEKLVAQLRDVLTLDFLEAKFPGGVQEWGVWQLLGDGAKSLGFHFDAEGKLDGINSRGW